MLELRPWQSGDETAVFSWIDSELTFYRWSAGRFGAWPITPAVLANAYAVPHPDGPFPMIMTDEGVPVGHLLLRWPGEDRSVIRFGFVLLDASRRGKGYGHRMLTLALAYAYEYLHARRVTIGVFADNEPARRCYRQVGFCELPGLEEHYTLAGRDWLCLEMAYDF